MSRIDFAGYGCAAAGAEASRARATAAAPKGGRRKADGGEPVKRETGIAKRMSGKFFVLRFTIFDSRILRSGGAGLDFARSIAPIRGRRHRGREAPQGDEVSACDRSKWNVRLDSPSAFRLESIRSRRR